MEISIKNSREYDKMEEKVITEKVEIKKTIFGVTLTSSSNNKFIKEAKELSRINFKKGEEIMKDKIDEFRKLNQCIDVLSPVTVSSHTSDLNQLGEVDYNDPESYKRAQQLLEKKQKERELKKMKKQKEKEEKNKNY